MISINSIFIYLYFFKTIKIKKDLCTNHHIIAIIILKKYLINYLYFFKQLLNYYKF